MAWIVRFCDPFEEEFQGLPAEVQEELLARARLLQDYGPNLGRPWVDTLSGSDYANMKELRFDAADGVWRVAFAFDPRRQAILLIAGDKSGGSQAKFYKWLLRAADQRYAAHLRTLHAAPSKKGK
jgi:hypothetical protein